MKQLPYAERFCRQRAYVKLYKFAVIHSYICFRLKMLTINKQNKASKGGFSLENKLAVSP